VAGIANDFIVISWKPSFYFLNHDFLIFMLVNDKDVTQAKYLHLISFSPAVNSVFDLGVNLKKLSSFMFRITNTKFKVQPG